MKVLELEKIKIVLKKEIKTIFYFVNLKGNFGFMRKLKIYVFIFLFLSIFCQRKILSDKNINEYEISTKTIKWKKLNLKEPYEKDIFWKKIEINEDKIVPIKEFIEYQDLTRKDNQGISSFNRSIVFDNSIVGPDISWLVPSGFKWNNKYKFDSSIRGHSGRFEKGRKGKSFWGWNEGDAVGQFYYQFLNNKKTSFGLNFGIRSVYKGSANSTAFGEGQSLGFRKDYMISPSAGIAFGAEQLLHFDGLTDSGRDIYLTVSKAFWSNNLESQFPLDIYTFGFATGRMAEGNIKFLCSNLFGGSGTELFNQRSLCWSPVFSISRVFNKNFSTFFEYNSKWFLLGSSIIPFNEIPLRGTFAVQLSDHIDNYKLNNFDELKWVFRLSFGF